ncbi:MAG: type II toxin-antitoxin system death-on-curing family toxin [Candidatus Moraniibacteriota bacterium]|jgi:death-on-curing family protein|nr:MAG: type II toxin-antitoxin system death-on-curing family toxin [Candidatus Moranbacteria bacterium]
MRLKRISVADVEYTAHRLAQETMNWTEPIPDFSTRYTNSLERSIEAPFQSFSGKQLYPGLLKKSAILFYLIVKNHPFQNGNKRIAMTTTLYFLFKNKKWLRVDNQELYNFAKWVAESNPKLRSATVSAVETFFETYMVDL